MKKIIRIPIFMLAVLGFFGSCDYLEVKPSGQVIPETVGDFRAMLVKGYDIFPVYKNLLAVRADEVFPYAKKGAYDDYISVALWDESNPGEYTRSYPWLQMYNVIFYANSILENVDESAVAEGDSGAQLKGEAFLLRAYAHFELLNLYARPYEAATAAFERGIPLSLKVDIEQHYRPATVAEVYDRILEDIEAGQKTMQVEKQPVALRYRFSQIAAKALEARVRLYRSEWKQALEAAEVLLPYPLEDLNEPDAVSPYYFHSKEAILALENVINTDLVNSKTYILPNLMSKYHTTEDLRVGRYFRLVGENYELDKGNGDDMKVTFRAGEIYLIAAEAAAHLEGKLEIAKHYLKELLRHRLTPAYYAEKSVSIDRMNRERLLAEIMDERARELALEGHRWYDLRRTTRPEIRKVYQDKNGHRQTAVLQENDARYTIRFPKEAIEHNPDLNR